jgi:uncharacterized RDD family membrane protein YckC
MMRIVLENALLFLLPALIYVTYKVALSRGTTSLGQVINEAPLVPLIVVGALVMFGTLIFFATTGGGKPGQAYQPGVLKDGRIEPGRMQ